MRDALGASAAAAGLRSVRAAARLGLVNGAMASAALMLVAAALVSRSPWLAVVGVVAAVTAGLRRGDSDPLRWFRGARGEEATAHLLSRLPRRFVVFHDRRPPGGRGNLDHLVVGPSGVWVIDSKARRARLRVHRGEVCAGMHPIDVAPVTRQAAALGAALGVPVGALVAVHGVGLRRRGKVVDGVRILPAARVRRPLRRGHRLGRRDVVALARAADRLFPRC